MMSKCLLQIVLRSCLMVLVSLPIQASESRAVYISPEEMQDALKTLANLYERPITAADIHNKAAIAKALRTAIAKTHTDKTPDQVEQLLKFTSAKTTFQNADPSLLISELKNITPEPARAAPAPAAAAPSTPAYKRLPTFDEVYENNKKNIDYELSRIRLRKIKDDTIEALESIQRRFLNGASIDTSTFQNWKDRLYNKVITMHIIDTFKAKEQQIIDNLKAIIASLQPTDLEALFHAHFSKMYNDLAEWTVLQNQAKHKTKLLLQEFDQNLRASAQEEARATAGAGPAHASAAAAAADKSFEELQAELQTTFNARSKQPLLTIANDQEFLTLFFNTYILNPKPASELMELNNLSTKLDNQQTLSTLEQILKEYRINRSKADAAFKTKITQQFFKSIAPYVRVTLAMINPDKNITPEYLLYINPSIIQNKTISEFCTENEYDESLFKGLFRRLLE